MQNATLRANVLFGAPWDEAWYAQVLDACALGADLAALPAAPSCGLRRGHPGHRRCTCSSSSGHTAHSSRYGHPQRNRTAQLEDNARLSCSTRPPCAAPAISLI